MGLWDWLLVAFMWALVPASIYYAVVLLVERAVSFTRLKAAVLIGVSLVWPIAAVGIYAESADASPNWPLAVGGSWVVGLCLGGVALAMRPPKPAEYLDDPGLASIRIVVPFGAADDEEIWDLEDAVDEALTASGTGRVDYSELDAEALVWVIGTSGPDADAMLAVVDPIARTKHGKAEMDIY